MNAIKVSVRWHDGYLEEFDATEVRFGCDILWLRLLPVFNNEIAREMPAQNRHIPLRSVRWFSVTPESHATVAG